MFTKFIKKLKTDRKFLLIVIGMVIALLLIPYITIPVLVLWWFFKKSKFTKRFKTITTICVVGVFILLIGLATAFSAKNLEQNQRIIDATKAPTTQPTAMQTAQSTTAPIKTASKPIATPTPTIPPIDQDKQAVKDAVTKVLLADMKLTNGDTKDYPTVSYSDFGTDQKESLIHDINLVAANPDLGSHGRLDVEFSALPLALNVSYYNAAEEATVDVLAALQSVKLNTPVSEITVAAWGLNKDPFGNPQCQNLKYMRMTFVDVTPDQLSLVTPDQWQDLNGQQEFDKMKSLGLKTELDTYYEACNQTSYQN